MTAPESAIPLSQIHRDRRDLDAVVAWRRVAGAGDVPLRRRTFLADVARFESELQDRGARPGDRFALCSEDGYAFAVALVALWLEGCVAVTPPNARAGTLAALGHGIAGLISDEPRLVNEHGAIALPTAGEPLCDDEEGREVLARLRERPPLAREAVALELFTSGTTGDGKSSQKKLRHLADEVAALERLYGSLLGDTRIVATASHQHLYGLLFRVLWPLCSGRAFHAQSLLQAEEILACTRGATSFALASVPAHLARIAQRDGAARLAKGSCAIFSSGGPLPPETADRWRELGRLPIEILGSTETGGVAWRQQVPGEARMHFQAFPDVQLECAHDGRLEVRSPFADGGESDAAVGMGDRVRLLGGGRFVLQGRADRVVKIGEKRLSLPEMESRLLACAAVSDAALVTLERAGEMRVAAVVVPSAAARASLDRAERRVLARELSDALANDFDRVLLPRTWRFVEALPEDAQGKRPVGLLRALFDEPSVARRPREPREPRVLAEERTPDCCERSCEVPADLAQLDGHFPGSPIVPAVAQLAWVLALGAELSGGPQVLECVELFRLNEPLRPGDRFRLRVALESGTLRFRLWGEQREFSSGRLRLGAGSASA